MFRLSRMRRQIVRALTVLCAAAGVSGCNVLVDLLPAQAPGPLTVALQPVASGLTSPVAMAIPPDGSGRLFVLDQVGKIRIIDSSGNLLATPFLDLRDRMVTVGIDFGGGFIFDERGLLGLAFHPNYAHNGRFFVFYTAPKGPDIPATFDSETHISEFHVSADANVGDASTERLLIRYGKPQFNHNGGQLAFGPDNMLYISTGDGGNANDEGDGHTPDLGNGQDRTTLLGKILRIDIDNGDPYATPPDNPFVNEAATRHEIWALGLRNPWRFSFDRGGFHRMFVADVGQDLFEEVDIVERGGNYGWHIREGFHCFDSNDTKNPPAECTKTGANGEPLLDPILEYPHTATDDHVFGIAAVGGFVYRGSGIPALGGQYFFGDFTTDFVTPDGSLFTAAQNNDGSWTTRVVTVQGGADGRIGRFVFGIGQDASGELYVLSSDNFGPVGETGRVDKVVAAP